MSRSLLSPPVQLNDALAKATSTALVCFCAQSTIFFAIVIGGSARCPYVFAAVANVSDVTTSGKSTG